MFIPKIKEEEIFSLWTLRLYVKIIARKGTKYRKADYMPAVPRE
ncbi:hypothetical protein CLV94_3370 [Flavobacterium endophyticum]|jgi:hypothetical protein|uniref:Uncharacterized protein n=1 Tax=Flavobacterium endophyticum TaxID=1540163 RepID=A0A495LYX1_9FLAO|nr:hypothetical protein [Flavobacterium sp. N2550]RKS17483.1 hypothetical protein CLV94_3370 [Flavobacterium endophyticum]